jgi:hypothetical protein
MITTPPELDDSVVPVAGVVPVHSMKGEDGKDTLLLLQMSHDAEAFLRSFSWCGDVQTSFFGGGVGGVIAVFLFNIQPTRPDIDPWIWIVVGDIPSAYLPIEDAKTSAEVFKTYLSGMLKWVQYARSEQKDPPGKDVPPVNVLLLQNGPRSWKRGSIRFASSFNHFSAARKNRISSTDNWREMSISLRMPRQAVLSEMA